LTQTGRLEKKHEPASDIDSLKALDPDRPIREADIAERDRDGRFVPKADRLFLKGMKNSNSHCRIWGHWNFAIGSRFILNERFQIVRMSLGFSDSGSLWTS